MTTRSPSSKTLGRPRAKLRRTIARFLHRNGLRRGESGPALALCGRVLAQAVQEGDVTPERLSALTRSKDYSVPLDRAVAPRRAALSLSAPSIDPGRHLAIFAEHALEADGTAGRTVILLDQDAALESQDLGRSWKTVPIAVDGSAEVCFTTRSGCRLVATAARAEPGAETSRARVRRFDPQWRPTGEDTVVNAPWHGTSAIGEKDGVILFAEYPSNRYRYNLHPIEDLALVDTLPTPARVLRSRDDGVSWEVVFTASIEAVRHLHTLLPDPDVAHRWWLTSGDRFDEVFVWRSDDDGDSWIDVTAEGPDRPVHPSCGPRAVQRLTDAVFHDGWMLWGSDDVLGSLKFYGTGETPVGSRIYRARTDGAFQPEEVGVCGPSLRSIVDVGPAFLFISEAKAPQISTRAQTYLVFKDALDRVHPFVTIDNYAARKTGFTHSRASRKARDGVFFTYRSSTDAVPTPGRVLRWRIVFE